MPGEVKELVVKLTPEGADETQEALSDTGDEFEETADRSEDASRDLNRFSRKFTGALAVAAGVMGGIAAKFLSMVPAVQEAFIGIGSVIDGLIIQFEEDFGPGIRDIGDKFFALGQDVRDADGFIEALGITAAGTADIVGDIGEELAKVAGKYTAKIILSIDAGPEEEIGPLSRIQDAILEGDISGLEKFLTTGPGPGPLSRIQDAFTRGFITEMGFSEDAVPWEMTRPNGTRQDPSTFGDPSGGALKDVMREIKGAQRHQVNVAIEGKSPSVDDDLTVSPT